MGLWWKIYSCLMFYTVIKDDHSRYDYTDKEIKDLFIKPRSSTLIRKHRSFQFILIQGVVYTNERLMKSGFVTDNLCSLCQREPETYLRICLKCDKVISLWKFIINHFDINELRNLDWRDIFGGISGYTNRSK